MPFPRVSTDLRSDTGAVVAEQRISADSHMAEPPDLWETRLPQEFRDRAPHFPHIKPLESRAHLRAGGWDPHERLRDQAYDGISAEVCTPHSATLPSDSTIRRWSRPASASITTG